MKGSVARALVSLVLVVVCVSLRSGDVAAQVHEPAKPASLSESDWRSLRTAMSKVMPLQKIAGDRTGTADDARAESPFGVQFGTAVAVDGDTALVGAWLDDLFWPNQGSAYVFVRVGSTWVQQAHLVASEGMPDLGFGRSVALQGDIAVIGAEAGDAGVLTRTGSAYVFRRTGSVWSQETILNASDGLAGDQFGHAVAVSGDTVVVGAPGNDFPGRTNQGSAYVFVHSGGDWTEEAQVEPPSGATNDRFGDAVSISGDTMLAGGYLTGADDRGGAYVSVRSGTTWSAPVALTPGDPTANAFYGRSVHVNGDDAIVGASGINAAYVFVRSGTVWTQQQKLQRTPPASGEFGHNVKIVGDRVLIGAVVETAVDPVEPSITTGNAGAAYIFERSGTVWTQQARLASPTPVFDDALGIWVSLSGDTALIGCYRCDPRGITNVGSALVFVRSGASWILESDLMPDEGAQDDRFGANIAVSGDTAIVGLARDDLGTRIDQGSAYVFVRNGITWDQQARLVASDGAAGDEFGNAVSVSGDTAIVGAIHDDVGANPNQGSAYVFVRSGTSWTQQAKLVSSDGVGTDEFGASVSVDGDSAVIGAIGEETAPANIRGAAYVFTRSGSSWTEQQKLVPAQALSDDQFGVAVAIHGDTVVGGAHLADIGANVDQGAAYVYTRAGGIWTEQQRLTADDGAAMDMFGTAIALRDDTIIIGAPEDDAPLSATGSAYVYTRTGGVWTQQAQLQSEDRSQSDRFGYSVALLGDLALIGAYTDAANANVNQGSAYLFARSGQTWSQRGKLIAGDGAVADQFGSAVGLTDGVALVGAWMDDGAYADEGSVYAFTSGELATVTLPTSQSTVSIAASFVATVSGSSTVPADGTVTVTASTGESCSDTTAQPGQATSATFSCSITFASTGSRTMTASYAGSSTHDAASSTATHTVQALPSVAISNASSFEGTGGSAALTFSISRSHALNEVSVTVSSSDGSASSGVDYVPLEETVVTLPAGGMLTTRVEVQVITDTLVEIDETLTLMLSAPSGATLADDSATGTILNDDAIVVTPASLQNAPVGEVYSTTLSGNNGTAPYAFSVTAGALPPGMTLETGGLLSGTPTQAGNHSFTITATDSAPAGAGGPFTGSRAYVLAIAARATSTQFSTDTNATIANLPVELTATVTGFVPGGTVEFRSGAGSIPGCASVALAGTGNVKTATCSTAALEVGTRSLQAVYSGDPNNGTSTSAAATVMISAPTITVAPSTLPAAEAGVAYAAAVSASGTGATTPYTFAVVGGALPPGIELGSNGTFSGTTNSTGNFNVTIRATDSSLASVGGPFTGQLAYTIAVGLQPTTTTIGTITPAPVFANQSYVVPVTVSGASGTPGGSVSVNDGAGASCTITLATANSCTMASTAGTKTITANYLGQGAFAPSSGTKSLTVSPSVQVGAIAGVPDRIGFRDRDVTLPLYIRGDGQTVKFSARLTFDPLQFQSVEVRPVAPATCTQPFPNQIEVSTLGSSRTAVLPSIDTPFCDVTFQLKSNPAPQIELSIDPGTTTCVDAAGNSDECQARSGRILVSSLITQPDDGTQINIAGYVGQPSETRVLIFSNVGTTDVAFEECSVSGTGFSLVTGPPATLPPGSSSRVFVGCTLGSEPGTRSGGLLQCETDDAVRTSLTFGLACVTVAEGAQLPGDQVFNNTLKESDQFGHSTAVSDVGGAPMAPASGAKGFAGGTTQLMVIGAPFAGSDSEGRIFIFEGDLTPKARRARKTGDAPSVVTPMDLGEMRLARVLGPPATSRPKGSEEIGNKFGTAVAIDATGTLLAVGAPTGGENNRGQVLLYERPQGGWGELGVEDAVATIDAPPFDGLVFAQEFGNKLAFTPMGDLVVGAPGTDSFVQNVGAIYFYQNVDGEIPTEATSRTTSPNAVAQGRFGDALAANDQMIVVGAPQEGVSNSQTGAAYILPLANGTPSDVRRFVGSTATIGDKFGSSVAIAANGMFVVGSPNDDTATSTDIGSATVFRPNPSPDAPPVEVTTLVPPEGANQAAGTSVATNGDLIVLGAPRAALDGNVARGRAYLFDVEPQFAVAANLPRRPVLEVLRNSEEEADAEFGFAVAINRSIAVAGVPRDDRVIENVPTPDVGRADPFALERIFRADFE